MRLYTPEIAWHNRDPVLSIDVQPCSTNQNDMTYRIATGGTDSHIIIWRVECNYEKQQIANVDPVCELTRHQKSVNVVRFSPNGELLASGDDESIIMIWKKKGKDNIPDIIDVDCEPENRNREQWSCVKALRLHLEDVYDLSWSPDSNFLLSGSVDNTAIVWNIRTGRNEGILRSHKGFVQGVCWDPLDKYIATLGSDRFTKTVVSQCSKSALPSVNSMEVGEESANVRKLFQDDTLKTYFRRLSFSPDGNLLIVPSGVIEPNQADTKVVENPIYTTYVFLRDAFQEPVMYYPSGNQYSVAVQFCPVLFQLSDPTSKKKLFDLPYRMVFAIATKNTILLYDTEHVAPFAFIKDIHYTSLTDISWSSNGRILLASSTDGYCTFVVFAENELGLPYIRDSGEKENSLVKISNSNENNPTPTPNSEKSILDGSSVISINTV